MLLKNYEEQSLLCNISINGATSKPDTYTFRGDLVLEPGDIADTLGRRMPPKSVIKQAILLVKDDKLAMVAGAILDLAFLPLFVEHYRGDLASGAPVLLYVENLSKSLYVELDGVTFLLQAHDGGAVWNTLGEDLKLDKEDFKGQSAEDKVITVYNALLDFKPKLETLSFADALGFTVVHRREARGPI